jgi:4-fold beta flower protein
MSFELIQEVGVMWVRLNIVRNHMKASIAFLLLFMCSVAFAQDEISLFDGKDRASAYIVADDDLTICVWSGEPVAYLVGDSGRDFHVYGFNGSHLGWLVGGIVRDHNGDAACANRAAISSPQIEPIKSLKSLKSLKNLNKLASLLPLFPQQWGELPCRSFMKQGES